jgi:hypothetical protein
MVGSACYRDLEIIGHKNLIGYSSKELALVIQKNCRI